VQTFNKHSICKGIAGLGTKQLIAAVGRRGIKRFLSGFKVIHKKRSYMGR
jgi:hypothetical protein